MSTSNMEGGIRSRIRLAGEKNAILFKESRNKAFGKEVEFKKELESFLLENKAKGRNGLVLVQINMHQGLPTKLEVLEPRRM